MSFKLTPQKPPYYETTPGGIIIGSYRGIINQTGTNEPTAVILQNSFPNPVTWTRAGLGLYVADTLINGLSGFIANKTWVNVSQSGPFILTATQLSPENQVWLSAYDASGVLTEGLDNVSVHIILFK